MSAPHLPLHGREGAAGVAAVAAIRTGRVARAMDARTALVEDATGLSRDAPARAAPGARNGRRTCAETPDRRGRAMIRPNRGA